MQMHPKDGGYKEKYFASVEEEYAVKDEHCNYNKGSSLQMKKPDHFKNNYDQKHGYGGQNGQFKHGYGGHNEKHHKSEGENYSEYSESWYEEERRGNARNDYSGHGGNHHNGYAGMRKQNGYGAHEGRFGPHKEHQYKFVECFEGKSNKAPTWEFKSIRD